MLGVGFKGKLCTFIQFTAMLNGKVDPTTIYVADCRRKVLYGPYFVVNVKDIPLGVFCSLTNSERNMWR